MQGCSSSGRANDSKSLGRGFESLRPCQFKRERVSMEKTNSKIITLSFAIGSFLAGLVVSLLIKAFAGAFAFVAKAADVDLVRHGLPLVVGFGLFLFCQFNPKVVVWANEVVSEVKKVVWPSRKDTTAMTIVVCVMVLISSLIISSFDLLSGYVVNSLMR